MSISNENFSSLVFLLDLNTQCLLFKRSYEKLAEARVYWLNIYNGIEEGIKYTPLDIMAECIVCLSSMSAIKRVIGTSEYKSKRNITLQHLLGEPSLSHVFTKNVRNSWEHHDERLDKLLKKLNLGDGLSGIYVSPKPPKDRVSALKRFDPISMTIYFLDDGIKLDQCLNEIEALSETINNVISKMNQTEV